MTGNDVWIRFLMGQVTKTLGQIVHLIFKNVVILKVKQLGKSGFERHG